LLFTDILGSEEGGLTGEQGRTIRANTPGPFASPETTFLTRVIYGWLFFFDIIKVHGGQRLVLLKS